MLCVICDDDCFHLFSGGTDSGTCRCGPAVRCMSPPPEPQGPRGQDWLVGERKLYVHGQGNYEWIYVQILVIPIAGFPFFWRQISEFWFKTWWVGFFCCKIFWFLYFICDKSLLIDIFGLILVKKNMFHALWLILLSVTFISCMNHQRKHFIDV